jgi:EAL domain-containing protein (putative c-di-GMP-specific phosphodiesterase class I)
MTSILRSYSIDPRLIALEITESTAMLNVKEVTSQMEALSTYGIRFSIDDFGTGHSSLGRLDQLPLSVLKIDRSFTERLGCAHGTDSIVRAIIALAKTLHIEVVAEGIESEEQIACLRELGCDHLQGFLLSRPVKPELIPSLVRSIHPMFAAIRAGVSTDSSQWPAPAAAQIRSSRETGNRIALQPILDL